jgi:hypothetical protein
MRHDLDVVRWTERLGAAYRAYFCGALNLGQNQMPWCQQYINVVCLGKTEFPIISRTLPNLST